MTERGNKGSPASEGASRTAGMHVVEESDCVVVPVKLPNNERVERIREAKVVEGSTQSKENICETHTSPTQSGNRVCSIPGSFGGLAGVRQVARERKQEKFTALLHHVTVDLLRASFHALKQEAAHALSGMGAGASAPKLPR